LVGGGLGGDGAFVAIAEGVLEGSAVGGESDVVNSPTVDGDGGYAFRGGCGGFAEAFFKAGEDCSEGPVKR
jgi:hypothetical protein